MAQSKKELTLLQALQDPHLLGAFIHRETWGAWFTLLRAMQALPPEDGDEELFQRCTGRQSWPTVPARETYIIAGRRSGKSINAALLATYMAAMRTYCGLSRGERATIPVVSPTKQQSRIIQRYVWTMFRDNPLLSAMIERETTTELDLNNGVSIETMVADQRTVRGYTSPCVILDESAFFSSEAARSDVEVIRAWRPALATLRGILVCISSPYAKTGALFNAHRKWWGKDGDVLVWQSASTVLNPTLDRTFIEEALADDPEASSSEWLGQFRADIESFVAREAVEQCVIPGRYELPYVPAHAYVGFVDPSGGRADAMYLAVGHKEGETFVLDCLRSAPAPFSPDSVVDEFATTLKSYKVHTVAGDRYGGIWPEERFKVHGIAYEVADKAKSDLYRELLPLINSRRLEMLDHDQLTSQLVNLERRTSRSGKDSIDHGPGGHDDLSNVLAGVAYRLAHKADFIFARYL